MKLQIKRYAFGQKATLGKVYVNGQCLFYSLEDKFRELADQPVETWKVPHETAIPKGTYKVVLDFSPHFGKVLPHLLDVPGFTGIRIHPGNTDADSSGCILVGGKPTGEDFIPNSRATFEVLMELLDKADEAGEAITIEVG